MSRGDGHITDSGPAIEIVGVPSAGSDRDAGPPGRTPSGPGRLVASLVLVGAAFAVASWALGAALGDDDPELVLPPPSSLGVTGGDLTVSASTLGDTVVITATADGQDSAPWVAVEICATDPLGCTPLWTRSIRQIDDTFTAELELPAWFVSPGGRDHDCRGGACSLRVITSSRSVVFDLADGAPFVDGARVEPIDVDGSVGPAPRPPAVVVEPPVTSPGSLVTVSGSDFASVSNRVIPAGWVLCDERPTDMDDVAAACGTPRIVRTPVIASDGTFRLVVPAPDPAITRTWRDNRALDCASECWLAVLSPGTEAIASTPIRLRGP